MTYCILTDVIRDVFLLINEQNRNTQS